MKTEIEDIIDCILKWDSENNSDFVNAEYFKVIQRDLKKAIAEQPKTPQPAGWECPRCHTIHSYLKMSCDCSPQTFTFTTCGSTDPVEDNSYYNAMKLLADHNEVTVSDIDTAIINYINGKLQPKTPVEQPNRYNTSQVEQLKSAEEWFENNFDCYADEMEHDKRGVTMAMTKETFLKYAELNPAVIDKKEVTDIRTDFICRTCGHQNSENCNTCDLLNGE